MEAGHHEGDSSKMDMKWSYSLEAKEGLSAKQLKLVGGKLSLKIVNVEVEPPADTNGLSGVGGMLNMGQKMGQMVTSGSKELLHHAQHAVEEATHHHQHEAAHRGDAGAAETDAKGGAKAGAEAGAEGGEGADAARSKTRKMSTEQIEHDAEEALEEDHDLDDDAAAFFEAEAER